MFKWEGDELVLDNNDTTHFRDMLFFGVHKKLAEKMGWIVKHSGLRNGGYKLGPNLRMELPDGEIIPVIAKETGASPDLLDDYGISTFFVVYYNEMLYLSVYANWRFVNLNESFQSVAGNKVRSFFVY